MVALYWLFGASIDIMVSSHSPRTDAWGMMVSHRCFRACSDILQYILRHPHLPSDQPMGNAGLLLAVSGTFRYLEPSNLIGDVCMGYAGVPLVGQSMQ